MDLVKAARKGDNNALLQLFDEHHAPLFRFAWRLTGSMADAEDIVQECFLGLLRPDCRYDERRTPPRTYLFGAARTQALKRLRKRVPELDAEPMDSRTPEEGAMRSEVERSVERAVRELPELQREVVILAHYEQMPLGEIAALLEIELGAVKSRLQRARASLKESLAVFAAGEETS